MTRFLCAVAILFAFLAVATRCAPSNSSNVLALPSQGGGNKRCKTLDRRREWRDLTARQRSQYIQAVLCLQSRPSRDNQSKATTRYEEFLYAHVAQADRVHFVGQFLPWHRHLVTLYSKALREECGFRGPTPFWDWSRDAEAGVPISQSPIFDPVTGFGGNGVSGTYTIPTDPASEIVVFPGQLPLEELWKGCVQDGPFRSTKFMVHVGPGKMLSEHCVVRGMDSRRLEDATPAKVQLVLDAENFEEHWRIGDSLPGIHNAGHALVGGEMTNLYSSSADPIFYLHHAALDRVWWKWQRARPEARLRDISGPTTPNGTTQVTLDFKLDFPGVASSVSIRDVMDSYLEPNCFIYE